MRRFGGGAAEHCYSAPRQHERALSHLLEGSRGYDGYEAIEVKVVFVNRGLHMQTLIHYRP